MRPDRIIVGEVRDAAAIDMLQALNTGHPVRASYLKFYRYLHIIIKREIHIKKQEVTVYLLIRNILIQV
jgi:pilus assembly protein CpaF